MHLTIDFIATDRFTLRRAAITDGHRGSPVVIVVDEKCTPVDPTTRETVERMNLSSPLQLFQTYTGYTDIRIGDFFEVGSVVYQVRGIADYQWPLSEFSVVVVLEKVEAPADVSL